MLAVEVVCRTVRRTVGAALAWPLSPALQRWVCGMGSDLPSAGRLAEGPRAKANGLMEQALRQSKSELYIHLVWATAERQERLKGEFQRAIYRCLEEQARQMGCVVLAIGGMPDHVHLVVRIPAKLAVSKLAQQLKGVSSHFAHDQLPGGGSFSWQAHYGAFSLSRTHMDAAVSYVKNQHRHHEGANVWLEWEKIVEEVAQDVRPAPPRHDMRGLEYPTMGPSANRPADGKGLMYVETQR